MKHRSLVLFLLLIVTLCLAVLGSPQAGAYPVEGVAKGISSTTEKVGTNAPDTFIELNLSDAQTLDPALAYDSASFHVIQQIYETLIRLDPNDSGRFLPMLAKNWQVSADGLTYTFDIRQGTHFHNGGLLQAHDVAYTIRRGLLQSDPGSPQWTLITPIMGYESGDITQEIAGGAYAGDPDALRANASPAELLATCNKVMTAVSADDSTGRVVIRLASPRGDFIAALAQYAPILDNEWAVARGAWDGDCNTWQNYYAPGSDGSPLSTATNGTGPFHLESWQQGTAINLIRFPQYWQPAPSVPVNITRAIIKIVPSSSQQQQMLLNGQADFINTGHSLNISDHVLFTHDRANDWQPTLTNLDGMLRAYTGVYSPSADDAFFVFNIDPAGGFIGSGTFDGDGIPANFFSDIHARKAFNYAFDFATYKAFLEGISGTTPIQRTGPIIKDLPGYNDGQPVYTYNPTLAMQEFQQAWGGQAIANGFRMTLPYAAGNMTGQTVVETIKAGIEALDPKFHIDVVEIPWGDYLGAQRTGKMPLYISGWIQDYAHPHNWVAPYLIGTHAGRQQFPPALLAKYQGKVAACLLLSGDAARTCYQDIQINSHQDAPGIYLFQRTGTSYVRAEVGGFEASGLNFGTGLGAPSFFSLWKSGLPAGGDVVPGSTAVIEATSSSGATVSLDFPSGAVAQDTQIVIIPDVNALDRELDETRQTMAGEYKLSRFAFEVEAFDGSGQAINPLTLLNPAKLMLRYTNQAITPLTEDGLVIMRWDGAGWVDGTCGPYQRDPSNNTLAAPVCMTGLFAMGGLVNEVFIPVVLWH